MASEDKRSTPPGSGNPPGKSTTPMAVSELFLQQGFEEQGFKHNSVFIIIAVVIHLIFAMITFPSINLKPREVKADKKVQFVRKYVPPPPKVERQQIQRREITRKVAVPDPTPEEPEPIIEPEPDIVEIEDIPPDVEVLIGEPEPPPVTGPLMAGIGGVTTPELIAETKVQPEYPELARRARIEGKVFLQAVIRKDGTVGDIKVLREPPGSLGFAEKAQAAVSQWRYRPAMQNNRPVDVYFTVTVSFTLE